MERTDAVALLDRLHEAQNQFYGGGDNTRHRSAPPNTSRSPAPLTELLTPDIAWTVPGDNRIAGTYHGLDEVFAYFRRRRDLARGTFRMHRKDILVGAADRVVALTDGTASLGGEDWHWSTVGLYDVTAERQIAACWLLPLDQAAFDSIWSA